MIQGIVEVEPPIQLELIKIFLQGKPKIPYQHLLT